MKKLLNIALAALSFISIVSCAGKSESSKDKAVDDDAFYATQPLKSGQYRAESYDISGDNARKGKFDGRMLVALSPEQSGIYVYENGNRAKIDYTVALECPFEKGDSGIWVSKDVHGLPVTIATDSLYVLTFEKKSGKIAITFDPRPMSTGSALTILEKISKEKSK